MLDIVNPNKSTEFKCRAWCFAIGKMYNWTELLSSVDLRSLFGQEYFATNPPKYGWRIMRYSGYKDIDGKEIYEGDILQKQEEIWDGPEYEKYEEVFDKWLMEHNINENMTLEEIDETLPRHPTRPGKIDYCLLKGRFWLANESFGYEGEDLENPKDWKIIGNVFKNCELLEELCKN